MKVGAIDIGTNSVRLLVGAKVKGKVETLKTTLRTPRLGEGINESGILKELAIKRTIDVLKEYKEIIEKYRANAYSVATSAVRLAQNKEYFVDRVRREVGLEINVIGGEEEARLSYLGLVSSMEDSLGDSLMVDIGGGSTEFVLARQASVQDYWSIELGALRLTEDYGDDLHSISKKVAEGLKVLGDFGRIQNLFGVGGTVTTLASIEKGLETYSKDIIHGTILKRDMVWDIYNRLAHLSARDREKVEGLTLKRAEIILAGIIILMGIMDKFKFDRLKVSDAGILEGLIYDKG